VVGKATRPRNRNLKKGKKKKRKKEKKGRVYYIHARIDWRHTGKTSISGKEKERGRKKRCLDHLHVNPSHRQSIDAVVRNGNAADSEKKKRGKKKMKKKKRGTALNVPFVRV